jgi:hypothetical protein
MKVDGMSHAAVQTHVSNMTVAWYYAVEKALEAPWQTGMRPRASTPGDQQRVKYLLVMAVSFSVDGEAA